ncbi:lipopolysaccharide biosynthesis protein [Vibrio breoganii]
MRYIGLEKDIINKILTVLTGGVLAQIITLAFTPLITRIYSPEEFGVFSQVSQLSSFIVPLLTLSLPLSIVKQDVNCGLLEVCLSIVKVALTIFVFLNLIVIVVDYTFDMSNVTFYMAMFIALNVAIQESLMYVLIRKQYYKIRSIVLIIQALVISFLKLSIGKIDASFFSLFISTLIGYSLLNSFVFIYLRTQVARKKKASLLDLMSNNMDLIKYRTPQSLISNLNILLPILAISYYYTTAEAGMYALARTVLVMPATILGKSISDVFYPRFSDKYKQRKGIISELKAISLIIFCISFAFVTFMLLSSDWLFEFIFGKEWSNAGVYAKWVSVWVLFNIINKPFVALIPVFRMEKYFLKNSFLNLAITVVAIIIGSQLYSEASDLVLILSIMTTFPQLIIMLLTTREVLKYEKEKISNLRGI